MAHLYKLRDGVTFLNHGSYGKCPREVLEKQQSLRDEMEEEPVDFIARRLPARNAAARGAVERFVNAEAQSVVFVRNVTVALNGIVRSLEALLNADCDVVTTNMEYGACDRIWEYSCQRTGARYVHHAFDTLSEHSTPEELAREFIARFTPRTKVVFLSHIPSQTALILPVGIIARVARERGIISVIDGAHALGQIPLDMRELQCDFYTANCHKWLQSPKGAGILYARPEVQKLMTPLVIGWGYHIDAYPRGLESVGSEFVDGHFWAGTDDHTPSLTVPTCIEFLERHNWAAVRSECFELCRYARRRVQEMTGLPQMYPDSPEFFQQMVILPVPVNARKLSAALWENHRVEIPGIEWLPFGTGQLLRISVQHYITKADVDRFLDCLAIELAAATSISK